MSMSNGIIDANGGVHATDSGRFTGHVQAEGDADTLLGAPAAVYVMAEVPIHSHYVTQELPSPRHRKLVDVVHEFDMAGEVRTVTNDQAPVAFEIDRQQQSSVLREFDGDLYAPYLPRSGQNDPDEFDADKLGRAISDQRDWPRNTYGSEDAARQAKQEVLDNYLVVDGQMWRKTSEPMYVVQTFGFGGNHGGTSVCIDSIYNSNIQPSCYYRADQFEEARARAIEVAEARGDTIDAGRLRTATPPITVHNPAAVTAVMPLREPREVRSARSDFRNALETFNTVMKVPDKHGPEGVARAQRALSETQDRLAALTGDIAGLAAMAEPHEDRPGTWRARAQS